MSMTRNLPRRLQRRSALLLAPLLLGAALPAQAALYITIVQGLGGEAEYQQQFDEQRSVISAAAKTLTDENRIAEFSGDAATREALLAHFASLNTSMGDDDRAALYLIGHGSFDGEEYKFNLPGPDITAQDVKDVLDALPGRNHFVLNTSSTSGAMVELITGVPAPRDDAAAAQQDDAAATETGKYLLVAATRNGNERNATQFGRFFAEALTSEEADINKNNNVSVQEAFDYAVRGVEAYFTDAGRLATEHPQLRGRDRSAGRCRPAHRAAAAGTSGTRHAGGRAAIAPQRARQRRVPAPAAGVDPAHGGTHRTDRSGTGW